MEKLTKRDLQRIETRERLFQAAIDEFNRVGFEKAQIEAIVKKADVSVGTFYRNFASKNDVIIELMQRYLAELSIPLLEELNKESKSLEETLLCLVEPIFDFLDRERDNPLIKEVFATVLKMPTQDFEWIEHPFLQPIIQGFEQHTNGKNYDAIRLTRLFFTGMFGFITIMNPIRSREEAKVFIRVFLDGIK